MTFAIKRHRVFTSVRQVLDSADQATGSPAVGDEATLVYGQGLRAGMHFELPVSTGKPSLEESFEAEAEKWLAETMHLSNYVEKFMHPSYQRIIGMGPGVVPFLLADLRQGPRHWFWALHAITGANPVPPDHAGNVRRMTQDWLEWAKLHGYE